MTNKFSDYIDKEIPDIKVDERKKVEDMVNEYSRYSESELLSKFNDMASKKKKDGTWDKDMSRYTEMLAPYLTDEQKEKMNSILNNVK